VGVTDDVVGCLGGVEVMLDQQDGVSGVHEPIEGAEQCLDVDQVQA
jgi:hypothetical protein